MKLYQSNFDYNYSFPAVTLAYFLRYPNPYSKHVLSTDVIDRYVDPETKRLHTLRLHLKRSKVPAGILNFLPRGLAGQGGASESYILERSTIDAKEGWMETESRNLEWTGILSVIERQSFRRQNLKDIDTSSHSDEASTKKHLTTCKTTVTFISKFGQAKLLRKKSDAASPVEEEVPKQGFFASWSASGIQRTIELLGMKKAQTALVNGKEGMNVVLQRLRQGGIVEVLEGMRKDRLDMIAMMGGDAGPWKQAFKNEKIKFNATIEDVED